MKPRIGVIGTSQASIQEYKNAEIAGREIAKRGGIVICGGLSGIMEAASRGAKLENGLVVGILPGSDPQAANEFIDIPVVTGLGEGRNLIVVKSSEALIAIGGGFGTLSEISFALRLDIPIIGLNTWNVSKDIITAKTPYEAVEKAFTIISNDGGSAGL